MITSNNPLAPTKKAVPAPVEPYRSQTPLRTAPTAAKNKRLDENKDAPANCPKIDATFPDLENSQKVAILKQLLQQAYVEDALSERELKGARCNLLYTARQSEDTQLVVECIKALTLSGVRHTELSSLIHKRQKLFYTDVVQALALEASLGDKSSFSLLWHMFLRPQSNSIRNCIAESAEYLQNFIQHRNFEQTLISKEDLLILAKLEDPSLKRTVMLRFVENIFFKRPELFNREVVDAFLHNYVKDVPEVKYLNEYFEAHNQCFSEINKPSFPLRKAFQELMGEGEKHVLLWYNLRAGMGDELIRTGTIIHSLLSYNPTLQITVYSNRPFLYCSGAEATPEGGMNYLPSNPRVTYRSIKDDAVPTANDKLDMLLAYKEANQTLSREKELAFADYASRQPSETIQVSALVQGTLLFNVNIKGLSINVPSSMQANEYSPVNRLCAELGLPLRVNFERKEQPFCSVTTNNTHAERYWQKVVKPASQSRPIVVFNGIGGETADKGYGSSKLDFEQMRGDLIRFIAKEYFPVLIFNGRDQRQGREGLLKMTAGLGNSLLIAPSPVADEHEDTHIPRADRPYLYKHLIANADLIYTVEGGLMHLAWLIQGRSGAPILTRLFSGAGLPSRWVPIGLGPKSGTIYHDLEQVMHVI